MNRDDILNAIAMLAQSQGFYGRLLRDFIELREGDPDRYDEVMEALEAEKFGDPVDMVLFFEC